ncbi:MAG: nucleotide disphospho-sugar-binding domain-containing protein [Planctomycetota bacterium]
MSAPLQIDFVAPPFAGHLFPLLQLARSLTPEPAAESRVLTTASGLSSVELSGQRSVELLPGYDGVVTQIADTTRRVGSNPYRLLQQLRLNLSLMAQLRDELTTLWSTQRPDLVVADFTVPIAGLTARRLGIEWWTGMPTPCALESADGPPSYLGGWAVKHGWAGRCRDALGRLTIRLFKRTVHRMFAQQFRDLYVPSVYRKDGHEVAYSPNRILGFGLREFEFARKWPDHFEFIGPLTAAPPFPASLPPFASDRKHILVTLGTHLPWARTRAWTLMQQVAGLMPDCVFHFTDGDPGTLRSEKHHNLVRVGFIPYCECLHQYDAAIVHGGTGITYACIEHRVPMLVWPHDYDQFDHAARVTHHRLGLRLTPTPEAVTRDLQRLVGEPAAWDGLEKFYRAATSACAESRFRSLVLQRGRAGDRGNES